MQTLEQFREFFLERYNNYPQAHYVTVIIARQIQSEAIFRTEGSGEPLNKEFVHMGADNEELTQRVVISKRKQTAVERRTGRDILRQFNMLHVAGKKQDSVCTLNTNTPCEKCLDCMIYGFAAGGGGAQKARVVTDDAFSLHPARVIVGTKQFNALYDNSTMRNPEDGKASSSIGTDEYVKPEAIFLDMETFRDMTLEEFVYVMGNVLRSTRYGAISSRIGKVKNHVLGVVFSNCEIFSNLELTQAVYSRLLQDRDELDFPLPLGVVAEATHDVVDDLQTDIPGWVRVLMPDEVGGLIRDITDIYRDSDYLREVLTIADNMHNAKG